MRPRLIALLVFLAMSGGVIFAWPVVAAGVPLISFFRSTTQSSIPGTATSSHPIHWDDMSQRMRFSDGTADRYVPACSPSAPGDVCQWSGSGWTNSPVIDSGLGVFNVKSYGATGDGVSDDTAAIQAAINAAAVATHPGPVVLPPGNYAINSSAGIVLKSGVSLLGAGSSATKISCAVAAVNCITIAAGPVQGLKVGGFQLVGDYTNANAGGIKQRGMLIMAVDDSDPAGAGLWWSDFDNIIIKDFTGEGMWLRGYHDDFLHPIQFLTLRNVQINAKSGSTRGTSCYVTPEYFDPTHANGTTTCYLLRMTGEVNQVAFIGGQVNGVGGSPRTGTNIYVGEEINSSEVSTPISINFESGFTCQSADTCAFANVSGIVNFRDAYFEALNRGVYFKNIPLGTVSGSWFANACSDGASGGYCVQVEGTTAAASVIGNRIIGTVDKDFKTNGGTGSMSTRDNATVTTGALPSGNTAQFGDISGTITTYLDRTVLVNSGTTISTIASQLGTGEDITLVAWSGSITLQSGGNISFGTLTSPLVIPSGGVVRLVRFDLGNNWTFVTFNGGTVSGDTTFTGKLTVSGLMQTGVPTKVGTAIASATTIAPTAPVTHITGTTTIQTITAPSSFTVSGGGGCLVFVFDGVAPWNALGNIFVAGTPTTAGTVVQFCYDNATAKWYPSRTS